MATAADAGAQGALCDAARRGIASEEMLQVLPLIIGMLCLRDRGRAMQVCRAWRAAATERSLYRTLDLRTHRLTADMVAALGAWSGGGLESLRLSGRDNALLAARLHAPQLTTLSVDSLEHKAMYALTALAATFPRLRALQVLHAHKASGASLVALAAVLPRLQSLALDDALTLPLAAVAALPSFGRLTTLSIRYCALPLGFDLSSCAHLTALSLAGALHGVEPDAALPLRGVLPPSLRRLDVSLARVEPRVLDLWLADAPGRTLVAIAAVDAAAGGPYPARSAPPPPPGARVFTDETLLAAASVPEDAAGEARWLHAVVAHGVWAFLSLRELDETTGLPLPPPGPDDPALRTRSAELVRAAVLLAGSAHGDVREAAAGCLSGLANTAAHAAAMLAHGGWAALLRLAASADSEFLQELASEGVRNLTYQAADAEHVPGRLVLLAPHALSTLVAAWRCSLPRVRQYAAQALSDVGRMVIHLEPDGSSEQAGALGALLDAGVVPVYVSLLGSPEVGDQYAGARPLAIMSFLGRAPGHEATHHGFGNHPQASAAIAAMVQHGAIPPLLALLGPFHDADIRAEAVGVVRNCCFANAPAAAVVAASGGAAALAALVGAQEEETTANGAVESGVTALCNLACVSAAGAAAVAASAAPALLARAAASEAAEGAPSRWVAAVALCGLQAHGAAPHSAAHAALLARLARGVRGDGAWLAQERKGLVVQVLLQLAACTDDAGTHVTACRTLALLGADPHAPALVALEGGREVLRRLRASPARAVRQEADRAAAALGLAEQAPRASARLRTRSSE